MKKVLILFSITIIFLIVIFISYKKNMDDNSSLNSSTETQKQEETTNENKKIDFQIENKDFIVYSPAFENEGKIPVKYCDKGVPGGQNISIPIKWENVPEGTKSLLLVIVDTSPIARNWIHWTVKNIDPKITELKGNASQTDMPAGTVQLKGTAGKAFYKGPNPPAETGNHPYEIHLYALNTDNLEIGEPVIWEELQKILPKYVIAEAIWIGYYP